VLRLQGGVLTDTGKGIRMLDHFQMGPNLVRGFAPQGLGPRDISTISYNGYGDALGGTKYWGASVELQMPFWFLPKEIGLKGAVYADAGSVFGYQGATSIVANAPVTVPQLITPETSVSRSSATTVWCDRRSVSA
jgi:outer membrane protein insertion porin family